LSGAIRGIASFSLMESGSDQRGLLQVAERMRCADEVPEFHAAESGYREWKRKLLAGEIEIRHRVRRNATARSPMLAWSGASKCEGRHRALIVSLSSELLSLMAGSECIVRPQPGFFHSCCTPRQHHSFPGKWQATN
jgi:hypothetical protein